MNRGNIEVAITRGTEDLKSVLDSLGVEYTKVNLWDDVNREYYKCKYRDYSVVMKLWKDKYWPARHIDVCNINSDGEFCIGEIVNWYDLDSNARYYILMMGG